MKILFSGDIVSSPGRRAFTQVAGRYKKNGQADCVCANAENTAGGNGLQPRMAQELFSHGADALSLGDHTWDQKELIPFIDEELRLVRPANFPPGCPGRGYTIVDVKGVRVCIISLLGRTFTQPTADCPFRTVDALLERPDVRDTTVKLVDFHAEATSEKVVMGFYLDGRVSAVLGTHTHIQTSDARVLAKGTGYITDLGMTGPRDSILGREYEPVLKRFMTGMPARFEVKKGPALFEGALLEVDDIKGHCVSIRALREEVD
jgi:hypothetical protein